MSRQSSLGALRTIPQAEDEPSRFGDQAPRSWDVVPGLKVRKDGVYPAVLVTGYTYTLTHDGIGWQLTPEGERPQAYLVDAALQPVNILELAHRAVMLDTTCHYTISRHETGAWHLLAHAGAMT